MKLIPRLKPFLDYRELIAAITPSRNKVETFEQQFAQKFGCQFGTMFSHGRSGLYALLKAWDLDQTEVVCPAYTCVVVQHAIVLSGNIPVFVDCAPNSPNMDYNAMAAAITAQTRAVVVTHLFGYPMDVHRVDNIVRDAEEKFGHKIYIIQDAAHSYGTKWNGEMVTGFGDAAIFGSNISKIITSIFGGMITTNSADTHQRVQAYRNKHFKRVGYTKTIKRLLYLIAVYIAFNKIIYAFTNWLERSGALDRLVKYYDESVIDFPADWDQLPEEIEARVGLVQLSKYDRIIELRQKASLEYFNFLKDQPEVELFPHEDGATYSHFVAMVPNRQEWLDRYFKRDVQLGILVEYSVPYMKAYQQYKRGEYPISQRYAEQAINIPNWPGVKVRL